MPRERWPRLLRPAMVLLLAISCCGWSLHPQQALGRLARQAKSWHAQPRRRSAASEVDSPPPRRGDYLRSLLRFRRPRGRDRSQLPPAETPAPCRTVTKIERYPRLPVWPVQNGLFFILLDLLKLTGWSQWLEDRFGGRVCPMALQTSDADPFVLLAHHRHSFQPWDPIRPIFRTFLPEGFPAHPHRGFSTVTYVLKGSMTHRDSMGIKQSYGNGAVQWLRAGRGILHEEMWDVPQWEPTDIEIYQLWVNLPLRLKMSDPQIQLVGEGTGQPLPRVAMPQNGTEIVVVAGEVEGQRSPIISDTDVTLLHIMMEVGATYIHALPKSNNCLVYVRKGELTLPGAERVPSDEGIAGIAAAAARAAAAAEAEGREGRWSEDSVTAPAGCTAFFRKDGDHIVLQNRGFADLDFMLLCGEPLREPTVVQASFVMNSVEEIQSAFVDLEMGMFGDMWDHRVNDEDWRKIISQRPGYGFRATAEAAVAAAAAQAPAEGATGMASAERPNSGRAAEARREGKGKRRKG